MAGSNDGTTRAWQIYWAWGLAADSTTGALKVDEDGIRQLDTITNYNDVYSGTHVNTPVYAIGDLVDIKYYNGSVESDVGSARLVYHNFALGTEYLWLDDNDGKGIIVVPAGATEYRIYPNGDSVNYTRVTTVTQEESTDGLQVVFDLDSTAKLQTLDVYRNGLLQQRVTDGTIANQWGPDAYWYDSGVPAIKFGTSHAPAQGEEITVRYRDA